MDLAPLRRLKAEDDGQLPAAGASTGHEPGGATAAATRRRFLGRAAAGGAVAVGSVLSPLATLTAAAQTDDTSPSDPPGAGGAGGPDDTTGTGGAGGPDDTASEGATGEASATLPKNAACEAEPIATGADLATVQFLESLTQAASAIYGEAGDRRLLTARHADTARLFRRHHDRHAEAYLCVAGGEPMAPNARLLAELSTQVTEAADDEALLQVLYGLEESLVATSVGALGEITSPEVAAQVASILPVQAEQAVVWGAQLELPLAQYLTTVQSDAGALAAAEYPAG